MWLLYILSWCGILVDAAFVLLSVASALYYLSEMVEEHTETSKKVIKDMTIIILAVYIGLAIFEDLPVSLIICGMISHVIHLLILKQFPYITVNSFLFIGSLILFILNHYLAFSYFGSNFTPFGELLGFFTVCIWLIPFALFISLSANDNVLPLVFFGEETHNPGFLGEDTDVLGNYLSKKRNKKGLRSFFHYLKERIFPQNKKMF